PSGDHSIVLEIIHFDFPICNEAALLLWIGQDFQTLCLQQDPITYISNIQQNITCQFYTLKTNILPNSNPLSRSNLNLIIIFIVSFIVFLIVINVLIWLMCSLRFKSTKSTSSVQNLYNNQMNVNNEGKRSIHKQFSQRSNRLKSIHSLLYVDHKAVDINPIKTNISRDLDSSLSQYNINSNSSSTNLNHHFLFKSKSTETLQQPRQINSWDDI
ncbi:unnamed protein product, partial [Rotaria sp. Silwood2]